MKLKYGIATLILMAFTACATAPKKVAAVAPTPPKKPHYQSAQDLFKGEQCADQNLTLKPRFKLLNDDADIFCVKSLHQKSKILKITSRLEPLIETTPSVTEPKYSATAFDLVLFDQKMKQRKLAKPIFNSANTGEFSAYYDFSKVKKFPSYIVILFKAENHTQTIFTKIIPPSADAMTGMSAISGAAGVAMGGFAAGSAVSVSQPKAPIKYSVFVRSPLELKTEWVSGIPVSSDPQSAHKTK